MRVESKRGAVRLRHVAATFRDEVHLMAQLIGPVVETLQRGNQVATVLRRDTDAALRAEVEAQLGPDARERVARLGHSVGPDGGSGQTDAARLARELRVLHRAAGGDPVTVVSEHVGQLDGRDGGYWTEIDAAVNIALADLPVLLICFYPELLAHDGILDGARRNHPYLLVDGELRQNPDHRDPREVLADRPAPRPAALGPPAVRMPFGPWQLHEVRAAVESTLREAGCTPERVEDVALAVNEVATNAVQHGSDTAQLHLWGAGHDVVCEVHDTGRLIDPLPGMRPPHPADPHGRGIWIARQLCDLLHVWADQDGTHVRIRAGA